MNVHFERLRQWLCARRGHEAVLVCKQVEDTGYGRIIVDHAYCARCGKELTP